MNLVLIGYRGTGKTALGRALARKLAMRYLGLDEEIVRRAAKTIPEFVRESGWERFRDLEAQIVREVARLDLCVVDTGGGAILRSENVADLKHNGWLVWLKAEVPDIVRRIGSGDQRPSLTGAKSFTEEVEEVLAIREPLYATAADEIVDTSILSEREAIDHIAKAFRARVGLKACPGCGGQLLDPGR